MSDPTAPHPTPVDDGSMGSRLALAHANGWAEAVRWLRRYAYAHAGKWAGMEPRDALREAAQQMEKGRG